MPYIASMGIYVFSKDVMLQLLREQFPGANDFGSEVIPGATSIGKRVWKDHCIFSCSFATDIFLITTIAFDGLVHRNAIIP